VGAGNQKGSVESLVKWVKGNFLVGRGFADDADLSSQNGGWLEMANSRPNAATGEAPSARLPKEAAKGGALPAVAHDYGFPASAQVSGESFVPVAGNTYSVPLGHVSAPVIARLHRQRVVIWRDRVLLADHRRAPNGAHQRIVLPEHFAALFPKKPRAQTMLEREALLGLGGSAATYVSELSRRRRERLGEEVAALYALYGQYGPQPLLAAMAQAQQAAIYGADYLRLLLATAGVVSIDALPLPDVPSQSEVDRLLSSYEAWVSIDVPLGGDEVSTSSPHVRPEVIR